MTTCAEVIFRFKESCVSSVDGMNQGRGVRLKRCTHAGKKSCFPKTAQSVFHSEVDRSTVCYAV